MSAPTLLAVSHGTSSREGASAIQHLVDRVAERLPDVDVRAAFVDVQQPETARALAAIDGPVVVVPLLLSTGLHVGIDLREAVGERPETIIAEHLGPDARLATVLAQRLSELPPNKNPDAPIILAAAGSRMPGSAENCADMAALLAEHTGRVVHPAYLAARQPSLRRALAEHPDATVSTYLLARGFFMDLATRHAAGRTLTAPLLDDDPTPEPLINLVIDRYREASGAFERPLAAH